MFKNKWIEYKNKSFSELDKEFEQTVKTDKIKKISKIIIWAVILVFLFPDAFLYWYRFCRPYPPKYIIQQRIDVSQKPIQIDIKNNKKKFVEYQTLEKKKIYVLEKMARYSISGKVVAKNYFFWGNYIPNGERPFQSVALFDVGLVWGDLADENILKYYNFVSAKDVTGRILHPSLKMGIKNPPLPWKEVNSKFSHTHVIPASPAIMYALIYTKNHEPIKMDGYLVDVYDKINRFAMTSLSREDTNDTSRGNGQGGGACEVMYVKRIQVGNKVYE